MTYIEQAAMDAVVDWPRLMWDDRVGVVWVLGSPGARRIEQYTTSADDHKLLEWHTYDGNGMTLRSLRSLYL